MIDVTKMNGSKVTVNTDLIETVEEMPDTVITLTTGKKFIIKESRQEVKNFLSLFFSVLLPVQMDLHHLDISKIYRQYSLLWVVLLFV